MNAEERTLLARFLQDLTQLQGGLKDAEAARLIDQAIRSNPDAAYVLVQHAMLADQALHAAQAQISDLQSRLGGGQSSSFQSASFLGGGAGPWSQRTAPPPQQPQAAYPSQSYAPPPSPGGLFGSGPAQPGGFGSFLRSAGTTAAGVAGGAFIADALSGLFGGHRGIGGGFGGGWGGGFGGQPMENVTINEYGDQPSGGFDDGSTYDDSGGSGGGGYDDGGVN